MCCVWSLMVSSVQHMQHSCFQFDYCWHFASIDGNRFFSRGSAVMQVLWAIACVFDAKLITLRAA